MTHLRTWRRWLFVLGAIGVLAAVGLGVWRARFVMSAASARGKVVANRRSVNHDRNRGGRSVTYMPTFEFTDASGAVHRVESSVGSSWRMPVGTAVAVLYDPDHPGSAGINTWWRVWFFPLFALGMGLGCAALAGMMTWVLGLVARRGLVASA